MQWVGVAYREKIVDLEEGRMKWKVNQARNHV